MVKIKTFYQITKNTNALEYDQGILWEIKNQH